ncbi:MAG: 2-phospho-L-lactate transferase [Gammaproteobacteria bacterium]|nr:2-phospho-L-lactate transferase [Gammaproteobacteria bacterium]
MSSGSVITLSGGVGGAKLVLGLSHILPPGQLTVVANTGDDFDHLGLRICPDIDTVIYTLADLANREQGWGRAGETWTFMQVLRDLGGEDWFNLGDGDLALHVFRTSRLNNGENLSQVTAEIARSLGIEVKIMPMSDEPVSTMVKTPKGTLAFQHYFVRERCEPVVTGFDFKGIENAHPNPALKPLLAKKTDAIVIAPSNPFVSVDPILSVPGLRSMLRQCRAPIIAVSPIVGGDAIKGPAAKMMGEMGLKASALEIARHYRGFIDALVIDEKDADLAPAILAMGIKVCVAPTVMKDLDDRIELARITLELASRLNGRVAR